ncbi:hypothetical protein GGTG_05500 [Gaeumannomyces tritici R3-111a-1]|uniref:Uncharacterized protein n=1 Tax=Gaeumannomyces tritici (strain R3-111a-1) TaxID=644352 RepID=J3NW37_GAET3|nr:hypothetical protein GGTG_05500 [Gaeumannomyces tritici R3-111a-1]EJT75567.1 hypothetical protein GGTG_05500 [Gaeumannomyces tritici R3-111a-1]
MDANKAGMGAGTGDPMEGQRGISSVTPQYSHQQPCACRTPAIGVELGVGQQIDSLACSKWWARIALALRSWLRE